MAMTEADKAIFDKVTERAEKRQEKQKERIEKKEEEGVKLEVERLPTGLYTVKHRKAGRLPEVLKGSFSSKWKLEQTVRGYYGSLDPLN